MEEFVFIADFISSYVGALQAALTKTAMIMPGLARQHIETLAKNKLSSSMDEYIGALDVRVENFVLIMEIDPDNWLACAVEDGVRGWDMTESHLKNSKKAKMSKEGYRYMHVPIKKEAGGKAGPSEKSKEIQKKINEVMKRPQVQLNKFGMSSNKLMTNLGGKMVAGVHSGGSVTQMQQLDVGGDPDISGLYRSRVFSSSEEYHQKMANKKGLPKWQLVMFRTISENPKSKHWFHPGLQGVNILKETDQWLNIIIEAELERQIKLEMGKAGITL